MPSASVHPPDPPPPHTLPPMPRLPAVLRLPTLAALLAILPGPAPAHAAEPLGPSSRRTDWVISEIHYHPAPREDGRQLEFVEIHNAGLIPEDLGGHRLSGQFDYTFPHPTPIPAGAFAVLAPAPADIEAVYGLTGVLGGFDQRLSNASGTLRLHNPAGAVLLEVTYSDSTPWPVAADGAGPSLVLHRASFGEADPRAWGPSARIGGSPGAPEPAPDPSWSGLALNELVARPNPGASDFIELHLQSPQALDVSGVRITDDPARPGFQVPPGTILPPGGFLAFDADQLGFGLSAQGETVFLFSPDGSHVIDAVRFGAQERGRSHGRFPDGAPDWSPLSSPTPGHPNVPPAPPEIVLHEIMYHPLSGDDDDEYVELRNPGSESVDLSGWRFVDGITFEFPPGTVVAADGFLVVARNASRLRAAHPHLNAVNTVGDFQGSLSNRGERLALARPQSPGSPDSAFILVTEVTYRDGGAWDPWTDGGGSSLERIEPRGDPGHPSHWAASDESNKGAWTLIEATGVLDHGVGPVDQLQLLAQGAGSYLIDDIEVFGPGTGNLVENATFDTGTSGWVAQGTLAGSTWVPDQGATAPGSYRIEAVARGDTGANRIRTALRPGLIPGGTATLRARVRWLRGHPEFLLRLRGNYLEAFGSLDIPQPLGTPGAPNSRTRPAVGPALHDLTHSPVLPAAGQPVVVSVRAHDPDGIHSVVLRYRRDPSPTFLELPMRDDGNQGDSVAGDGRYAATLPGQPAGSIVAFQVAARDASEPGATSRFPDGDALVRFGEALPPGSLGTYRLWMTQATHDDWTRRPKTDNTPLPVTFVLNAHRVVHGVGALFAGSPHLSPSYSTPSGNLCGYSLIFPSDDRFLGVTDVVLDWPGRDATAQQEPLAYWIARELGLPFNHRRYIRLHVNGVTETGRGSIYEDAQQVNSDLIASWSPDGTDGHLHKIEQWFEFSDTLATTHIGPPRLENYTTTGGERKTARYRWNWLKRAVRGSANDFQPLFDLVDAANPPDPDRYGHELDTLADIEQWMRTFATEQIVVNLDSWGYDIGKNMYAYQPPGGRWRLHMWDIDWVMLASAQHGYNPRSPLMYTGRAVFGEGHRDPVVGRMYQHPAFQRAYWRAIRDAVDGPLRPERFTSRLHATYTALVAQGVTRSSGASLAAPNAVTSWLRQRRDFLLEQLEPLDAGFTVLPGPSHTFGPDTYSLHGTAPIHVHSVRASGIPGSAAWPAVTTWTLPVPLREGLNTFEIHGLDPRGQPIPDAVATVTVVYLGPAHRPFLTLARLPGGAVSLSWATQPGTTYRLQASTEAHGPWQDLAGDQLATGHSLQAVDPPNPAHPRRFYRVLQPGP